MTDNQTGTRKDDDGVDARLIELLAHRDGERLDPDRAAAIEESPDARAQLMVLRQIKHELNELPAVAPPPDSWENVRARTAAGGSSGTPWLRRYPLAVAASAFLVAALTVIAIDPAGLTERGSEPRVAGGDNVVPPVAVDPVRGSYAALVVRSQELESALLGAAQPSTDPTQRALLYRIADVDSELSRVAGAELDDPALRQALWARRVELLETLAASRRANAVARRAVF